MKFNFVLFCLISVFFIGDCQTNKKIDMSDSIDLYNQTWNQKFSWDNCEDICFVPGVQLCWLSKDICLTDTKIGKLCNIILHEPEELLKQNIESVDLALSEKEIFIMNDHKIKDIADENPLFLLDECHSCMLSRLNDLGREARDLFEKKISEKIVNGYVNLGSNLVFQDLVILTRVLTKNPDQILDIHLIDPKYDEYAEFLYMYGIQKVDVSSNEIFSHIVSYDDCKPFCCVQIKWIHECFKQLVGFLKKAYPKSKIRFFLYGYVEDFLCECEDKKIELTNMVLSSDLGNSKEARRAFSNLISFAMERSSDVAAFFLDKDKVSGKAQIYIWSGE